MNDSDDLDLAMHECAMLATKRAMALLEDGSLTSESATTALTLLQAAATARLCREPVFAVACPQGTHSEARQEIADSLSAILSTPGPHVAVMPPGFHLYSPQGYSPDVQSPDDEGVVKGLKVRVVNARPANEAAAKAAIPPGTICDGDRTIWEHGGPFDCPGCSACEKASADMAAHFAVLPGVTAV